MRQALVAGRPNDDHVLNHHAAPADLVIERLDTQHHAVFELDGFVCRADLPAKVTCSRRKRAWLLLTAPVRRWHSRQWHMEMRDGLPSIVS